MGLGTLFAVAVLRTAVPEPPREEIEGRILSLISPEMIFQIPVEPEPLLVERLTPVPVERPIAPVVSVRVEPPVEAGQNGAADTPSPPEPPRSALLEAMLGSHGEGEGHAGPDIFSEVDTSFLLLQQELGDVHVLDVASVKPSFQDGAGSGDRRGAGIGPGGPVVVGEARTEEVRRTAPTGYARPEPVEGASGAEADAVRAALSHYSRQVKACYDSSLKTVPGLEGRIAVGIDIVEGRVTTATIEDDSIGDAELGRCVVSRIRTWQFPPTLSITGLYLPFSLSTGS